MRSGRLLYLLGVLALCCGFPLGVSAGMPLENERAPVSSAEEIVEYGAGYRFERDGWIYLHIAGEPYERGVQHGYLLAPELQTIFDNLDYLTYWSTGKKWSYFVDAAERMFQKHIDAEYLQEMQGIADGAQAAGVDITWQDIMTWNGYEELTGYWWPNEQAGTYVDNEHCSAFIATGSQTRDGRIVMAHNSWNVFEMGQLSEVILDIEPAQGQRMLMQSAPGLLDSGTDFAVTDAGLMVTETTIGGYGEFDQQGAPEFLRVRKAMQYADSLDGFVGTMLQDNNGAYANSWLLGDANTGEIMRFELGLKYHSVERTKDGYFLGFNAPTDIALRNLECSDTGYFDIRTPMGARRVRLTNLMEEYRGTLDVDAAEKIIADHYDVYLGKENHPCSRTVEGHYELDAFEYWPARLPYRPQGAVDGKVTDSDLARDLSLWARYGSSSGMAFDAEAFMKQHIQWNDLAGYIWDRPSQPWSLFTAGER